MRYVVEAMITTPEEEKAGVEPKVGYIEDYQLNISNDLECAFVFNEDFPLGIEEWEQVVENLEQQAIELDIKIIRLIKKEVVLSIKENN